MPTIMLLMLFVLGLLVGSFVNVLVARLPRGEQIFGGRSHCDHCRHSLAAIDLIPLLSYLGLRGKCRYCRKSINPLNLVVELTTALAFVWMGAIAGGPEAGLLLPYLLVLTTILLAVFFIDATTGLIPDSLINAGLVWVGVKIFLLDLARPVLQLKQSLDASILGKYLYEAGLFRSHLGLILRPALATLLGSLLLMGFFYLLHRASRGRAMGGGDVRYALLMGLITGFPLMVVNFFLSFLLGAIYALILVALGKKTIKATIAFGPFLVLGTLLTLAWGELIWNWYLGRF